jgi:hypothetical protein
MTETRIDARAATELSGAGTDDMDDMDDVEVEELVGDIVETREEMTVTVEEIGDRLDPHNIVEGAKESVRQATVGKVENMANTAGAVVNDAGEAVREAGSGILETITRNPIPAALVGIGVGWLALARRPAPRYRFDDRWSAYAGNGSMDDTSSAVDSVQRRAGDVAGKVGRSVDEVADQARRAASELPDGVRSMADQIGTEAGRLFQSNPLAVGAIAVAVGTAVALAVPATQAERRALAQPARQLMSKAETAATEALGDVEQTARKVEQDARSQEVQAKAH